MDATGKLTLETPEQIGIEFELAGLGSRFLAALLDLLCMAIVQIVVLILVFAGLRDRGEGKMFNRAVENATNADAPITGMSATATVLLLLSVFVVQWGYYIICESVTKGASPGKRVMGLRVIRDNGLPIGFAQSMLRNLVRLVDFLPWGYGIGFVAIFASQRSQRLGDLVAGTLVVRVEKSGRAQDLPKTGLDVFATSATAVASTHFLTADERHLIERYFARRDTLIPEARRNLLLTITAPLRARLATRALAFPQHAQLFGGMGDDEVWLRRVLDADAHPNPSPP